MMPDKINAMYNAGNRFWVAMGESVMLQPRTTVGTYIRKDIADDLADSLDNLLKQIDKHDGADSIASLCIGNITKALSKYRGLNPVNNSNKPETK